MDGWMSNYMIDRSIIYKREREREKERERERDGWISNHYIFPLY